MKREPGKLSSSIFHLRRSRPPGAEARPQLGLFLAFLLSRILAGCDSGGSNLPTVPDHEAPPPPPVAAEIEHGHYRGVSTIDGESYHSEAVLTVEGEFRLYVGGLGDSEPMSSAGLAGQLLNPEESMQLSGHLAFDGSEAAGTGVVVGEACTSRDEGRFCGESAFAELRLEGLKDGDQTRLAGEIRIATDTGEETWQLDLSPWSLYYHSRARTEVIGGMFTERLASFAQDDDVIISLDAAGRMFFQGPATGCTGNGVFTPHLDGEFFVFDVDLVIESCNAAFDALNTPFTGLATRTQNGRWDYDNWLVIFVSAPEGTESPVALTMYAEALPGWDY